MSANFFLHGQLKLWPIRLTPGFIEIHRVGVSACGEGDRILKIVLKDKFPQVVKRAVLIHDSGQARRKIRHVFVLVISRVMLGECTGIEGSIVGLILSGRWEGRAK
jgi:hypothetical protein